MSAKYTVVRSNMEFWRERLSVAFSRVLECLPPHVSFAVLNCASGEDCQEIHIAKNKRVVIKKRSGIHITNTVCNPFDVEYILERLCGFSYYAHEESIKKGFISFDHGVRVGVCGTAVTVEGKILSVKEINSLNIRIPSIIPSVCQPLLHAIEHYGFHGGFLVFSPPGVGKTTLLRHTALALSCHPYLKRVCLIDSRGELSADCEAGVLLDVYKYYPPSDAIEMAIRTMSPDMIICDEIGGSEEEKALLSGANKGVCVLASAHGDSIAGIMKNPAIRKMHEVGIFECYCRLTRNDDKLKFDFICREDVLI